MPRILHLMTRWLRGGAEAKTVAEIAGLRDRYDFLVAHGAEFEPEMVDRAEAAGATTITLPDLRHYDPLRLPSASRRFGRLVDDLDPDLVHLHSTEAAIAGRWALRGRDVPVVYTLHGLPFSPGRSPLLRWPVVWAERLLAKHTTRFAANADAIRDAYLDAGVGRREQYVTIPSGIDLDAVRAAEPADLPGEPPRVVFAGRLDRDKGFDRLLEAMERVHAETGATLVAAGTGPLREASSAGWYHPLGFRNDLPSVIRASDLLCLPSLAEGTPRVVTEAMALGVPVVASDVGGIPEQLGDGEAGILVPPGDAGALAAAIRDLVEDPERRERMGEAGRKRAERFDVDVLVERTDQLYAELLSEGS